MNQRTFCITITAFVVLTVALSALWAESTDAAGLDLEPGEQIVSPEQEPTAAANETAAPEPTDTPNDGAADSAEEPPRADPAEAAPQANDAASTPKTPDRGSPEAAVQDAVFRARAIRRMLSTSPWTAAETQRELALLDQPNKRSDENAPVLEWTPRPNGKVDGTVARKQPERSASPPKRVVKVRPAADTAAAWINTVPTMQPTGPTAPWSGIRTIASAPAGANNPKAVEPPASERRMACELKLVRVSDGRVLDQASAPAIYANADRLVEVLIERLLKSAPDDATITCVQLCNRRGTPQGRLLAEEMTRLVTQAVQLDSEVLLAGKADLRGKFTDERKMEHPASLTCPEIRDLLGQADYLIIGGVALDRPIALPGK